MTEFVEGDWNNLEFRMVKLSDHCKILAHLRENFYRDEPLYFHSGYEDEVGDNTDELVLMALEDNLSFIAIDKANGKIAGVRLTTNVEKPDGNQVATTRPRKPRHPKVVAVGRLLRHLTEQANIFERYPEINRCADFFMVSVDREYRGRGLAKEIYERAFKMLKALGYPMIKCIFTSPHTQKIARKRGFEEFCRVKLNEWENEQGQLCYPNATDEECAIFMVKKLD